MSFSEKIKESTQTVESPYGYRAFSEYYIDHAPKKLTCAFDKKWPVSGVEWDKNLRRIYIVLAASTKDEAYCRLRQRLDSMGFTSDSRDKNCFFIAQDLPVLPADQERGVPPVAPISRYYFGVFVHCLAQCSAIPESAVNDICTVLEMNNKALSDTMSDTPAVDSTARIRLPFVSL